MSQLEAVPPAFPGFPPAQFAQTSHCNIGIAMFTACLSVLPLKNEGYKNCSNPKPHIWSHSPKYNFFLVIDKPWSGDGNQIEAKKRFASY
jgi:hypothetical protein